MSEKIKILDPAFEYANEYVLENTRRPGLGDISTGWRDIWAIALMRKASFVEVREWQRPLVRGVRRGPYDSDTTKEAFAPFE
jgi:hypothetical protein